MGRQCAGGHQSSRHTAVVLLVLAALAVLVLSFSASASAASPSARSCSPGARRAHDWAAGAALEEWRTIPSLVHPPTGEVRAYFLHVPALYDGLRALPVLLSIHGGGGEPVSTERAARFVPHAKVRGFLLVGAIGVKDPSSPMYAVNPNLTSSWNAGDGTGFAKASNADDVGYFREIVRALSAEFCVDDSNVFASGISNGGRMSYRLACELEHVAAIAPVAAGFSGFNASSCLVNCSSPSLSAMCFDPARCSDPLPRLYNCTPNLPPLFLPWGVLDTYNPIEGGRSTKGPQNQVFPMNETLELFRSSMGCAANPVETFRNVSLTNASDFSTCFGFVCPAGANVTACVVNLGGHVWPGGVFFLEACYTNPDGFFCRTFERDLLGYSSPTLQATDMIVDFFMAHMRTSSQQESAPRVSGAGVVSPGLGG